MDRRRRSPPHGPHHVTCSQSQQGDLRLNALPDEVLHGVLTRLGCLRAAARTGVLSHRWRRLWTGIDEVTIRDLAPDAIRSALDQLARSSVSTLNIQLPVQRVGLRAAGVDSLLAAAAGLSPGELSVTIPELSYDRDIAVYLPCLDATKSLKLEVPGAIFVAPPGREFPVLETLSLSCCAMCWISF